MKGGKKVNIRRDLAWQKVKSVVKFFTTTRMGVLINLETFPSSLKVAFRARSTTHDFFAVMSQVTSKSEYAISFTTTNKVLGQKFPYTQVQLPMMPSLNLLDPHNHNLESLSSWHTS